MMYFSPVVRATLLTTLIFTLHIFTVRCEIVSKRYPSRLAGENNGRNCGFCRKRYPEKHDRVAIIGAGPAGIHMAYKLQSAGYSDITVFEKLDRVGGKSYTYEYKDVPHELGTKYVPTSYDEIIRLVREFDTGNLIPIRALTYWINPYNFTIDGYGLYVIANDYGITDQREASAFFQDAVQRYLQLYSRLFHDFNGESFPRPSAEVFQQTNCTFMEFLNRNNMTVLKIFFLATTVLSGYGKLDEIGALYGLMWNNPALLSTLITPSGTLTSILDTGYQTLWEKIVTKEKIKVIYNADIKRIQRMRRVRIRYTNLHDACQDTKTSEFDFLIIAANVKNILFGSVQDITTAEMNIFSKLKTRYLVSSLVESDYGRRGYSAVNVAPYNLLGEEEFTVRSWGDTYAQLQNFNGPDYQRGLLPGNPYNETIQSVVYYQEGTTLPEIRKLDSELDSYFRDFEIQNHTLIKRVIWEFAPQFSPNDMSTGILWDILDMQGHKNTWYIGSSVSFESAISVVNYNKRILKKFNIE